MVRTELSSERTETSTTKKVFADKLLDVTKCFLFFFSFSAENCSRTTVIRTQKTRLRRLPAKKFAALQIIVHANETHIIRSPLKKVHGPRGPHGRGTDEIVPPTKILSFSLISFSFMRLKFLCLQLLLQPANGANAVCDVGRLLVSLELV